MKIRERGFWRRTVALVVTAAVMLGMIPLSQNTVHAQYVSGNAPFINSWLVSGPYDTPVADEIYNTVVPENPNLAKDASTSASSATLAPNPPEYLVDGSTRNQWVTEGDEEPCWAQLKWETPITVGSVGITLWNDARHKNQWYDLIFTFADGTQSEPVRVESQHSNADYPTVYEPAEALKNVTALKIEVDRGLEPYPSITGISEVEVYQYALGSVSAQNVGAVRTAKQVAEEENIASYAAAAASSTWQSGAYSYPETTDSPSDSALPGLAIDGDLETNWISQMHDNWINDFDPAYWPAWDPAPTFTLTWDTDVSVSRLVLYERHNAAWSAGTSNVEKVEYSLKDRAGGELKSGTITGFVADSPDPVELTLDETVEKVASAEFKIIHDGEKVSRNVGLGFREVEVYGIMEEEELPEPSVKITPELGGSMVEGGLKWEYFDDRLWNRTYDDYQDLYGYYGVKKGVDTRNKYVYAHTYVYSPVQQRVQFRFGTSGENRLYVNDVAITAPSRPAEVQKDMVKQNITLKAGWNKILLQIKHTYTDDKNSNGVPIAKDNDVYYLGFYGRITDSSGNEVDGLSYSVVGTDADLHITTGGLAAEDVVEDGKYGRGLPENVLPIGYTEWPYVWNESQYKNAQHNLSASAFQFMADGGQPGYTWSVVEGSLPGGLTLDADGIISGMVECDPGVYRFTVQVEDMAGATTRKSFEITVKERPNKWFEEGRVSALSHTGPIYQYFVDLNFSVDLWAERASRQGHTMVSVESLQQNYYWPSRFADPDHVRQMYLPKDENGQVVDGLKQFEKAVKRYGMKFGIYYATEGGGLQHFSTDVFVQNVEDLILRYDPAYLYFDGPQSMGGANYDVMYSMVRNYSDEIIINANVWGTEYGDPDLRTGECSGIYERARGSNLTKRTIMEPWKSLHTKNNYTPYYARCDDYRLVAQEMIANAGRGMVDNNDQMPIMSRGTNWDSPEDVATRYPKSLQEFIDVREGLAAWFAPEGKTERHESTTGTMPYFLEGSSCGCTDDGKGNIDHFENGHGPQWGYATYRDNNIYLHVMKGPDGRTGFAAIPDGVLTVSPVADKVQKVIWLNEDREIAFEQTENSLRIDLSGVEEDQVDTIIKIVTDNPQREFLLTNVTAEGVQLTPDRLQIQAEGYMTYQALKAPLESVAYESADTSVAVVDKNGVATPVGNGTTEIRVAGTYEGVTKEDVLRVTVKDGKIYVGEKMISASLWVDGRESYGVFSHMQSYDYRLEGRSEKGGAIGLDAAEITMKCGLVDLDGGDEYTPVKIIESDLISFYDGKLVARAVNETIRAAVWAEVKLDGKTFTTNRVYMDIQPYQNLAGSAKVTASGSLEGFGPEKAVDGGLIEGTAFDASKWSVSGEGASYLQFDLQALCSVQNVEIHFNSLSQNYYNTPKRMEIQVSENGADWNTISAVSPPAAGTGAYFGFSDLYSFEPVNARYVRLSFPEGSNGAVLDILEVAVNGADLTNRLTAVDVEARKTDNVTAELVVTGYNGEGDKIDLSGAAVQAVSMQPDIVLVNESGALEAVSSGRAEIRVTVALDGAIVQSSLYADVDENGNLIFGDYLKKVKLSLDQTTVAVGDPAAVRIEGVLNTGKPADLSQAVVEYRFSDDAPVAKLESADVIYMPKAIPMSEQVSLSVSVTVDGVTVASNQVVFKAQGSCQRQ